MHSERIATRTDWPLPGAALNVQAAHISGIDVLQFELMGDTLTVRLGEELNEALQREARQSGIPRGELVRQAVAAHLRNSGARSVMSRHFGVMRGPADLSTNRSYRRAWTKQRG